ncbi:MAG: pyruvate synthase subunit beta [Desulfomonile tiedjei]|uniref:Pyruvate synthase subunit beta n=1 Tax=Desulfomonile tiedjei TaxID=2358 RepID=A0A9D6Z5W9_9BACT|nr:pyruvate synthase subunit beta [Desulfomonile tiedjei]
MATKAAKELPKEEFILPGTRSCAACGLMLTYRHSLKALDPGKTIVAVPASCMTVLHGVYPITPVKVICVNNPFAATGAAASGIVAGLKATGKAGYTVVAFAGDGGTYDIGIQSLSGALERGTDFMYVCYDNEGYMNTGTQRSSASPAGAVTTTTPILAKLQHKKDMLRIVEAHRIPYVATASPSFPLDLYDKVRKAKEIKGSRYIEVHAPCPPGWGFPNKDLIKMGKLAADTAVHVLYEIVDGKFRLTSRSLRLAEKGGKKTVADYVKGQTRFKKITEGQIQALQEFTDRRWYEFMERHQNGRS